MEILSDFQISMVSLGNPSTELLNTLPSIPTKGLPVGNNLINCAIGINKNYRKGGKTSSRRPTNDSFYPEVWIHELQAGDKELGVLGDRLCINSICISTKNCVEIWVMNECVVEDSWMKLFSVAQTVLGTEGAERLVPLACSKNIHDVLFELNRNKFFWYYPQTEKAEDIEIIRLPDQAHHGYTAFVCHQTSEPVTGKFNAISVLGDDQKKEKKKKNKTNRAQSIVYLSLPSLAPEPGISSYQKDQLIMIMTLPEEAKRAIDEFVSRLSRPISESINPMIERIVAGFSLLREIEVRLN
ncbi:hypothetical protein K2173_009818 [Erythroxylum novogranatense]|uniref:F-box associated domain-containing protein n=1 Tax=Erythroxylum novogranatense TaxID=1862640 RepID=A0AAV8SZ11_9ROSI|nr:hypothetical protein K2173_009818 [Erythroxylum novogranatense]